MYETFRTSGPLRLRKFQQLTRTGHCKVCKKMSGGAATLNQIIPKENLKYTNDSNLKKYTYKGASGNGVDCYYCGNCTSNSYVSHFCLLRTWASEADLRYSHHHQQIMGPDKIVVRTALLEGSENWPVGAQIFTKDQYSWEPKLAETTFPAAPE